VLHCLIAFDRFSHPAFGPLAFRAARQNDGVARAARKPCRPLTAWLSLDEPLGLAMRQPRSGAAVLPF